ncbi:acyl-CoA reductase [Bacillus sp. ISL-40]|uniref:acyl-CoA reductase n=1 Tax=unclassified Bacillus (in: firmicutes) TaxID=185979 RepID=UPI001BE91244|nr:MULTISPECIES: acyl-CoA reductase [unclassified Bacillus (in: firmicutes)]MBT2700300.1 acyl-CoA reductase [Bacillus sp. ISL-40]MBT2742848.1 acyl-CoA reductase [Bacillus sp. ISL-77]
MIEVAGYLPDIGEEEFDKKVFLFQGRKGSLEVEIPHLTTEQLKKVIEKVKKASAEALKSFTVVEIVNIIDQVIERLLDRRSVYRQKAETLLPIVTGYDEEVIRLGLTSYLKTFRKHELQRFLVEDLGNPLLLDEFQPRVKGGFSQAVGPDLITHIWAGNVPALPLWSFISGLLVKAGNIGKVSSAEPLFAGWFANLMVEVEPKLADCFAVVWWKGGDEERERSVFGLTDVAVGYGGNESLEALKSRIPITTRFLPFGHKISFGVVSCSSLDSRKAVQSAHQAAIDVVRYDQQGCYSPQTFYVQNGGKVSPKEFVGFLAHELDNFAKRYPRRKLSIEESAALASWRQKEEMSIFSQPKKEVLGYGENEWTVVYEEETSFHPSCLNRVVKVIAFDRIEDLIPVIAPYRSYLQTAGIAASPKELFQWGGLLGKIGVTRMTALGAMTSPEAGWHHDGRFNLLDLIQMVDIEASAEEFCEKFAPYVD